MILAQRIAKVSAHFHALTKKKYTSEWDKLFRLQAIMIWSIVSIALCW